MLLAIAEGRITPALIARFATMTGFVSPIVSIARNGSGWMCYATGAAQEQSTVTSLLVKARQLNAS